VHEVTDSGQFDEFGVGKPGDEAHGWVRWGDRVSVAGDDERRHGQSAATSVTVCATEVAKASARDCRSANDEKCRAC
jgi:hypothetical protein